MEDLLSLALIKRDRHTRTFSIHRLIQTHFLRFMTPENRQKSFCDASVLMYNVFPKKPDNNKAMLYDVWDQCRLWLQHVLQLKNSFVMERRRDSVFHACTETCATWVQCQRSVDETYSRCRTVFEVLTFHSQSLVFSSRYKTGWNLKISLWLTRLPWARFPPKTLSSTCSRRRKPT